MCSVTGPSRSWWGTRRTTQSVAPTGPWGQQTLELSWWGFSIPYQQNKAVDLDPDPAFQVNPDPDTGPVRIQSFDDQKLKKDKNTDGKFVWSKIAIYLCPSYRGRILVLAHKVIYLLFSVFVGHFCPPGSGSGYGSGDPLNSDPVRIRIHCTAKGPSGPSVFFISAWRDSLTSWTNIQRF